MLNEVCVANSKLFNNIEREDVFIYQGNLKLTNSKLSNVEVMGSSHLYDNEFNGLVNANGLIDLKDNTFKLPAEFKGDVKSQNNKFNDKLTIQGSLKDKESTFIGEIELMGKASFDSSTLQGILNIDSNEVKFTDSKVSAINFTTMKDEVVALYLKKNTIVNGDIVFSNKKGKIMVDSTVQINGNVVGGEILKK
jgi:hypothetical protein